MFSPRLFRPVVTSDRSNVLEAPLPVRLMPPAIDAVAAGKSAIAAYDKNGDGVISGDELDKCPAIKSSLKRYDNDGDGKVTAEAITARIKKWQATRIALMPLSISVEPRRPEIGGCDRDARARGVPGPQHADDHGQNQRPGIRQFYGRPKDQARPAGVVQGESQQNG